MSRPKTGEKRRARQPLKIDQLPLEVREAIQYLKNVLGKTWVEIEELSAAPYNAKWKEQGKGGFVPWEELPLPVLELFPAMRLPHSNLHRWYDLRVTQVIAETMARSAQARELAQAFASSTVANGDKAAVNAARDQLMNLLAENTTPGARILAAKGLISLAETMQSVRANDIKERRVAVAEKALQMKLDEIKRKTEKLMKTVEGEDGKKPVQLTREQLLDQIKELYGAI